METLTELNPAEHLWDEASSTSVPELTDALVVK